MGQKPLKPIKMQDSLNYKISQEKVEWSWKLGTMLYFYM